MTTLREASKESYGLVSDRATCEEINMGSLQRIADAVEKMASSYDNMRRDRDYYKERTEGLERNSRRMARRISALQGVITKMKRDRNAISRATDAVSHGEPS